MLINLIAAFGMFAIAVCIITYLYTLSWDE